MGAWGRGLAGGVDRCGGFGALGCGRRVVRGRGMGAWGHGLAGGVDRCSDFGALGRGGRVVRGRGLGAWGRGLAGRVDRRGGFRALGLGRRVVRGRGLGGWARGLAGGVDRCGGFGALGRGRRVVRGRGLGGWARGLAGGVDRCGGFGAWGLGGRVGRWLGLGTLGLGVRKFGLRTVDAHVLRRLDEPIEVRGGAVELIVDLAVVVAEEIAVDQHTLAGVDERRDDLALLFGEMEEAIEPHGLQLAQGANGAEEDHFGGGAVTGELGVVAFGFGDQKGLLVVARDHLIEQGVDAIETRFGVDELAKGFVFHGADGAEFFAKNGLQAGGAGMLLRGEGEGAGGEAVPGVVAGGAGLSFRGLGAGGVLGIGLVSLLLRGGRHINNAP